MSEAWNQLFGFGITVAVLFFAFLVGSLVEKRHYRSIREREQKLIGLPTTTFFPSDWQASAGELVAGSVVVSLDHFKRFLAGLRGIVGGRIRSYESLLDRGRREAVLRMREEARKRGYGVVANIRIHTSRIASARKGGRGTAGVEVIAYGTALTLVRTM